MEYLTTIPLMPIDKKAHSHYNGICTVKFVSEKIMTNTKQGADPRIDIARENLRMAAAKRRMSLSEVSRQAGMSRNGLQQFVAGSTSISYSNMLKVCDVLKLPVGIVHRPDAITDNKIRLYRLLDRMPDHLALQAVAEAEALLGPRQ